MCVNCAVFSIRLPCTGMMSGEVDVRIQLNVTIFSTSNVTVLDVRRKKICLKSVSVYSKYTFLHLICNSLFSIRSTGILVWFISYGNYSVMYPVCNIYLPASYAASRYCFLTASVCASLHHSVCLSSQNLENY